MRNAKKKFLKAMSKLILFLIGLVLISAFQNCSSTNLFQWGGASEMSGGGGGGGGHSYDGKIYVAYGSCPDGTIIRTRLILTSNASATLLRDECTDVVPRPLGPGDFSFDPSQPDQIKYAGLTLVPEPVAQPPASLSKAYLDWGGPLVSFTNPITYFISYRNYTATEIQNLKNAGHTVICIINAGTGDLQHDPDYSSFLPSDLGAPSSYQFWLDTRSANVRSIMISRLEKSRNIGCMGVMWDQTDAYDGNTSGFPLTVDTEMDYITFLSKAAHDRKMLVAFSNTHGLSKDVVGLFDMQYSESCYQKGYCADFQAFVAAGKPVFVSDDGPFSQALCDQAKASGYTLWFTSTVQDGTRNEQCP